MTISVVPGQSPLTARIFRIYDGTRPVSNGPITTQKLVGSVLGDGWSAYGSSGRVFKADLTRNLRVVPDGATLTRHPTWARAFQIDGTTAVYDCDVTDFAGTGDIQIAALPITTPSPLALQAYQSVGMVEVYYYQDHALKSQYTNVVFVWDGNSIDCEVAYPVGHFPPGMSMPDQLANFLATNSYPGWTVHGTGVPGKDLPWMIANFAGVGRPASFVDPTKRNIYMWHEVLNTFANNPGTTVAQVVTYAQTLYNTALAAGFDEVWWLDTAWAIAANFTVPDWTGSNTQLKLVGPGTAFTPGRVITWSDDRYAGTPQQDGATSDAIGIYSADAAFFSNISDMFFPDEQHPGDPAARIGVARVIDMIITAATS